MIDRISFRLAVALLGLMPLVAAAAPPERPEVIAEIQLRGGEDTGRPIVRTRDDDPAYWADRLQQAMLPLSTMRAVLKLTTTDTSRPIREFEGKLIRVQTPTAIRSLLTIERPADASRIIKVESLPNGRAKRTVYTSPDGEPIEMEIDPSEPILLTSLTYEDLGFVYLHHRAGEGVEFEASSDGAVVRLVSRPYGRYGRVVTRLDRKTALPIETEYYDRSTTLIRRVTYSKVDRKGLYAFPLRIESHDLRSGFRTRVDLREVLIGSAIYEDEFSDPELRRRLRNLR